MPSDVISNNYILQNALEEIDDALLRTFDVDETNGLPKRQKPGFNILHYNPRHDWYLHLMPSRPFHYTSHLAGIDSKFYKIVAKDSGYINALETQDLLNYALGFRSTVDSLWGLCHIGVPRALDLPNNPADLLAGLLTIFNTCSIDQIEKLKRDTYTIEDATYSLLHPVVQVLLSVIPQFDGIGYLDRTKRGNAPYAVTELDKIGNLEDVMAQFSINKHSLAFEKRLFLLLSAIETLQWSTGGSFIIIPDMRSMMTQANMDDFYKALGAKILVVDNLEIYLYGPLNEEYEEFAKRRQKLSRMLSPRIVECADVL